MKVEIEWQPERNGISAFYGIRLYPETNEEMANLDAFETLKMKPIEYEKIGLFDEINYLISFEEEKKK